MLVRCCIPLQSGMAIADLWRYLRLWEYGGIYSDFDLALGPLLTPTTITDQDDALLVVQQEGSVALYFMAMSPCHPLMFYTLHLALSNVLKHKDYAGQYYVPGTTGPEAIKLAFWLFRKGGDLGNISKGAKHCLTKHQTTRHRRLVSWNGKPNGPGRWYALKLLEGLKSAICG